MPDRSTSTFAPAWRPSGWVVGTTIGAMAVLCALTVAGSVASQAPGPLVALDVIGGLLALVLVAFLFRRPVPATVALAALAAVASTAVPPATAGTYVVGRTRPLSTAVVVAAVGAAGHIVRGMWRPLPHLPFGWLIVLVLVAHAALVAAGALSQARAHVLSGLAERAQRAERDRDELVARAVDAERHRIAREMHDVLAHRLSLLATYAGALEYRPDTSPEQLSRAAGVVRAGVHQALEEVRDVIGVLREDPASAGVPPPAPGIDQLPTLVAEARAAGHEIDVELELAGAPPGIVGRTVYRLVQEGLTNARKHAPGGVVHVRVAGRPADGVEVTVANAVRTPRAPLTGSGTGLIGLAERVRIVGGRLEHGLDGERFRLSAWLPWPP